MSAIVAFLAVNNAKDPWRGHAKDYVRKHPHFETAQHELSAGGYRDDGLHRAIPQGTARDRRRLIGAAASAFRRSLSCVSQSAVSDLPTGSRSSPA